ncbi:MAG: PDZ domain-containing protein [Lacunisphaera sp.]
MHLLLLAVAGLLIAKGKEAGDKAVVLEPFSVHGTAQSDFGIDVRIYLETATKRVESIFITGIIEGSDAADLDLKVGDQIMKIDGVPVKGMDSEVSKNSALGRILLNRTRGDELDLEITGKRARNITMRWPWAPGKIVVDAQDVGGVSIVVKRIVDSPEVRSVDLKPGDKIIKINQMDLKNLDLKADLNGQIDRIFSNLPRRNIQLEIITTRVQTVTLHAYDEYGFGKRHQIWD